MPELAETRRWAVNILGRMKGERTLDVLATALAVNRDAVLVVLDREEMEWALEWTFAARDACRMRTVTLAELASVAAVGRERPVLFTPRALLWLLDASPEATAADGA